MSADASPPTDESWLVLRAQAGSRTHLEQVAEIAQRFLEPRIRALFEQRADAEDVLQDVLFMICRRLGTLNDARLFRPWAHRIAMRASWRAINSRRRQQGREETIDLETLPATGPESDLDVASLLGSVSPASRVVLTLHYLHGMTLEATAAELGVAPGTVKSRLAYGLRQLRAARPPNDQA